MSARAAAIAALEGWAKDGVLYRWAGKLQGRYPNVFWREGSDCSGSATGSIYVGTCGRIDWRETHNAQSLSDELPCTAAPQPGDLVVYGRDEQHVTHVMTWYGDGRVIGACGGDSSTLTPALAIARGARVQFRKSHLYRVGFLGFRAAPLDTP